MVFVHPTFSWFIVHDADRWIYNTRRTSASSQVRESLRLPLIWPHAEPSRPLLFQVCVLGHREPPESLIPRESTLGWGYHTPGQHGTSFKGCSHPKLKHFLSLLFENQALK